MIKKKVKKIPKYSLGTIGAKNTDLSIKSNPAGEEYHRQMRRKIWGSGGAGRPLNSGGAAAGEEGSSISMPGGIATASNEILTNTLGIEDNSQAGVTLNSAAQGADIGGSIVPGWGHLIGGVAGGLVGSLKKGSVDEFGNITYGGIFGRSKSSLQREANIKKNSIASVTLTQNLQADYYNNPNVTLQPTTAAEGGIMRLPVDALVSPGEIAINPYTLQYRQFGSDNEEPNSKDNIRTILETGDNVKSHAKHMIMPNGKTPADNSKMVLDSNMPEEMKRKMIKKIDNWESAHRTKPQEYAKFDEGGITKYRYNKNLSEFAYWDKDKNEYKKEYLDWVNNLTEQDVRDIEAGKYGDMTEYFSKNKGKKLDVATAQKLMTDKKYGNWHKIGKAVVDNKIKNTKQEPLSPQPIKRTITGTTMYQDTHPGNYPIDYEVSPISMDLKKVPDPNIAEVSKRIRQKERKQRFNDWLNNTGNTLLDWAPLAAALFGDYDYHTESSQISPAKYIPTGVSIEPMRRAANESYAMARYNQANISPNTGAGMAYGLLAASNRAKTLADAYTWQQDAQNKLIAQNVGIYNDWRKQRDAYATQAIADTRANEGAAQQMRDSAIRDAYEFVAGRRNDRMRLAMMEPLAKYAFDDDTYKKIYSRAIV